MGIPYIQVFLRSRRIVVFLVIEDSWFGPQFMPGMLATTTPSPPTEASSLIFTLRRELMSEKAAVKALCVQLVTAGGIIE